MLSKKYRFHSRGGVRFVYRNGRTIRNPKISLTTAKNTRGKQRFAVVVSKKVLKSAVGRNRIRRRVYETIRILLPTIQPSTDYIFTIYTKEIKDIPQPELQSLIKDLLEQGTVV